MKDNKEFSDRKLELTLQDVLERVEYLEQHGLMLPIPTSEVEEDEEDEVYVADDEIVHMDVDAFVLNNTRKELDSSRKELDSIKKELDLHKSLVESTTVKYKSRLDMTQKVLNNTKEELDTTKKKLEEAESSIDRYTMEITLLKSNNASLDSIITQLDNKDLYQENLRLEQELANNKKLAQGYFASWQGSFRDVQAQLLAPELELRKTKDKIIRLTDELRTTKDELERAQARARYRHGDSASGSTY
jgi:chromosome segregation ATPase